MIRTSSILAVVSMSLVVASTGLGGGTITDGDAIYELIDSDTPGLCNFLPDGTGGADHTYQNWWWAAQSNCTAYALVPETEEYAGNTATLSGAYGCWPWTYTIELIDGDGPSEATLVETLLTTSVYPQPLTADFFAYSDIDAGGTYPDDTAELTDTGMLVTDPSTGAYAEIAYDVEVGILPVTSEAYQAAEAPYLLDLLEGEGGVTLNNTGLPFGPGDFTGAYQWKKTYYPLGSDQTYYYRTTTLGVPEPGTVALLALGALAALRRRR